MKLCILFSLFFFNFGFSQNAITSQDIIKFNELIAQNVLDGERELDTAHYMSKEELRYLLSALPDSINADSILAEHLAEYDKTLSQFKNFYKSSFNSRGLEISRIDSINWDNCSIDSIMYVLKISNPGGGDIRINWPESKEYNLENDLFVLCRGTVFITEGEKKYGIGIDSIHCDGKLKFYHTIRAPKIVRLKKF